MIGCQVSPGSRFPGTRLPGWCVRQLVPYEQSSSVQTVQAFVFFTVTFSFLEPSFSCGFFYSFEQINYIPAILSYYNMNLGGGQETVPDREAWLRW